jgi:tetratricopeptide (TPR) repeat protein
MRNTLTNLKKDGLSRLCGTASIVSSAKIMMRLRFLTSLLVTLTAVGYTAPVENDGDAAQMQRLQAARQLMDAGKPEKAVQTEIDPVIKYFEGKYSQESRKVYCARTSTESLAYLLEASSTKNAAVAIGPEWATAYFMKAYALIDLGRVSEARTNLTLALKLSPNNSQCLSELAHLYQLEKNWAESQKLFIHAEECARAFSPNDAKVGELTRALRGQGYNLVEMGKLNEAEAKYRECLKADPKDRAALDELKYLKTRKDSVKSNER